jgi:serine/threonine-protein kinase
VFVAELTGQTIAGCEIISELGHGGMGAVYKARQRTLNRLVAVKVMAANLAEDADFVTRFKREAATAAQLHHQNMVLVHSAGEEKGLCYIVMEFVDGRSLQDHITRHGMLTPRESLAITIHVAQALQYAWNKSRLIHRDIKPANIFLSNEGEVKVGDLGLAKNVGQSTGGLTQTGTAMGSPLYIAPEQAQGIKEIDFRADIYSLGCTLYHMLTGQPPYSGTDAVSIIHKHIYDPLPAIFKVLPGCPMPLGMLVGRMLAKKPAERHKSYEDLITDLYAVTEKINAASVQATAPLPQPAADVAATVPSATPAKPPPQPKAAMPNAATPVSRDSGFVTRNPKLVMGGAIAAVVLLLAGLFLWSPWKAPVAERASVRTEAADRTLARSATMSSAAALKLLGNVFTNSVGAEMVYIPPGEFMLGSTQEEQAWAVAKGRAKIEMKWEGESPRKATIKLGFWLGRTEVTVGQWKQFVRETGYVTDGEKSGESRVPQSGSKSEMKKGVHWRNPDFGFEMQDNHPVSYISWNDAMAFCEWLTGCERKAGRLSVGQVVRLPTEAEWEYACRAGTQTKFWWGEDADDGRRRVNWDWVDGSRKLAPADCFGRRGLNGFGLADMLGNVNEWCLDEFDATQAHEDFWTGNSKARVVRGGAFNDNRPGCRSACRRGSDPAQAVGNRGFRVAVAMALSGAGSSKPSTSPAPALGDGGILAPAETRVSALTTTPKVGEVFTLPLGSNVTMDLMGIPPGEFMLGSTKEEQAWAIQNGCSELYAKWEGEAPCRAAIKQGFWMGRTEVTVGQWKQFVAATHYETDAEKQGESVVMQTDGRPSSKKGVNWRNPDIGIETRDDHPVACISWNDAVAFCEWLTGQEQQAGRLPKGWLIRLPAEVEWEYACRAGAETKFWWGDSPEDSKGRLNVFGDEDGFQLVARVDSYGTRGRNRFGLADMLGNMAEWCLDGFNNKSAPVRVWKPKYETRVRRGGSFSQVLSRCRCASRQCAPLSENSQGMGFRVVAGIDLFGAGNSAASTTPAAASPAAATGDGGILAPAETRVSALTTNPKVGEVFTLPVGGNVTMDLMGIPPGEFMLGSTPEEQAWAVANGVPEAPVKAEGQAPRKTSVKPGFWMGRTEVTAGQWKQLVAATRYVTDAEKLGESQVQRQYGGNWGVKKGVNWRNPDLGFEPRDDHPVVCISWNDAVAFCEWLNGREQQAGRLPQGWQVRLPAEFEWEYACRAGTETKFWWGDSPEDGKGRLNAAGEEDGFPVIAPVDSWGARGRNRFGLADMMGNMAEWCLDGFQGGGAKERVWQAKTERRVQRGGSFSLTLSRVRCAGRPSDPPSKTSQGSGFRVVVGEAVSGVEGPNTSTAPAAPSTDSGILAPAETRVSALTTNPKVGEVFTLPVGGNVTLDLMGIPPGEFLLGSTKEEQAWAVANGVREEDVKREGEAPRKATIKQGFWMGRTEVTVGQWKEFVSATGYKTEAEKKGYVDDAMLNGRASCRVDGLSWSGPVFGSPPQDDHPVCCINWNDARAFCEWATERERKAGRLSAELVVRLPTEAEWEYACRAGTQTKFWWGESKEDGKDRLNCRGKKDGFQWVAPVASFGARARNRFGLVDMLGNVCEWCLDAYDPTQAHEEGYIGKSGFRPLRGGAYHGSEADCRCASRKLSAFAFSHINTGFRVCVGVER